MSKKIRIGTRGSDLALWQANHVASLLGKENTEIIIIKTQGDKIQNVSFDKMEGKGFFTKEIEEALLSNKIDLAVHSLKDLPTEDVPGLTIAAIPERGNFYDMLIIHPHAYDEKNKLNVKHKSIIGTSSMRRMAQIKNLDSSLIIEPLRGNVNTRLRKLNEKHFDAIVMAKAGAERVNLDLSNYMTQVLTEDIFIPAPAQGALGLQVRADDANIFDAVKKLSHQSSEILVKAERTFLKHFGGGCHVPIGAIASFAEDKIILEGIVASPAGEGLMRKKITGSDPEILGMNLAEMMKKEGAQKYL